MVSKLRLLTVLIAMASLTACAHSYFKVTDPGGDRVFYTDDIKRNGSAVQFKDAVTGGVSYVAGLRNYTDRQASLRDRRRYI